MTAVVISHPEQWEGFLSFVATRRAFFLPYVSLLLFIPLGVRAGAAHDPVSESEWAVKLVFFNVGQGDAAVILARNGGAVIVDMGRRTAHGTEIADFLLDPERNGVRRIDSAYVFASHYDADHIRGAADWRAT